MSSGGGNRESLKENYAEHWESSAAAFLSMWSTLLTSFPSKSPSLRFIRSVQVWPPFRIGLYAFYRFLHILA